MQNILKRLNVRVAGNPAGRSTFVFSHGLGTDHTAWDKVIPAFAPDHTVVTFDYAGSTGTGDFDIKHYCRLSAYVDDLVALSQALDLQQAVLIGHSAGAAIALLASIQAPARFSKQVLIGASPRYLNEPGYEGGFNREDFIALYELMQRDYGAWVEKFVSLNTANAKASPLTRYLSLVLSKLNREEALVMVMAVLESDLRDWLPLVTHPTLLLHAHEDPVVPSSVAAYLHQGIPNSTLKFLHASGHFPHISAADEVVAAIREFI